ncbi:Transmembrane protease serine 6 [Larimichthys crocea]|uniref:Uncharacterized protein n=1 Tax=Larimichthys crocea TaxID=215358 RepID=A0ACD3R8A2_LARCR|nr:Transmembrane protease serine 6 [Larimichthys crocea]
MALCKVICVATLLTLLTQENKDSNVRNTKLKASNMSTDQSQYEHLKSETTYSCVHSSCNFCYCFSFYKLRHTSTANLIVYLGRQRQEGSNVNEMSRTVTQIINHPDYNSETSDNDISLLKLSSPVTFTNYILPVCLAASGSTFNAGTDSWVTGWGNIGSGAVFCGQAPMNSRILGGSSVASAGIWPWMASLQKNGSHMCGGTLVAEEFVLSNANCFSSSSTASAWTVVLGRLKQNGSNPFEVTLNVTNITLSNLTGFNIAVLRLETKPTLSDYIQPVCLNNGRTFSVGTTCWAAGWGAGRGGEEQVLQEFQTSVVNCGNASSSESICTGSFTLEQGDSGGPLMCKLDGSWFQAAVLSTADSTNQTSSREDIMTFTGLTRFQNFLSRTVGTFPSPNSPTMSTPAATNMSNTTSGGEMFGQQSPQSEQQRSFGTENSVITESVHGFICLVTTWNI